MFTADDICPLIPRLHHRAMFLTNKNHALSDDIVSITVLRTLTTLDQVQSDLLRFMYRVLYFVRVNYFRRGSGKSGVSLYGDRFVGWDDMPDDYDVEGDNLDPEVYCDAHILLSNIAKLSDIYRSVVELWVIHEAYGPIAEILGVPETTVRTRLHSARRQLADLQGEPRLDPRNDYLFRPNDPKVCLKCGVTKTRAEFHRDRRAVHGVTGHCRDCDRLYREQMNAGTVEASAY